MKHSKILVYSVIFIIGLISYSCSEKRAGGEIAFYVSPSGNDSQSGTSASTPFATLQKARDAIRELKQNGKLSAPVSVYLLGGLYELKATFILTVEDSGTEAFPITYRAYQNEKPVISGGKKIIGK